MGGDASRQPTLSIGAVSAATDIPRETLRTWERRYGFPDPDRNQAGHRIYRVATVAQLRLMSRAIDAGHRPGQVANADRDALEALLDAAERSSKQLPPDRSAASAAPERRLSPSSSPTWTSDWLEAAAGFDDDALEAYFYQAWNHFGGVDFLERRIGPFLAALGRAWADGQLAISHEHFASERLRDFLTRQWRPLSDRATGPGIVMAALPDEHHCLGLHMAALAAALGGCAVSFLGADTPRDDIVAAADQQRSAAIIVSVSRAYDPGRARTELDALAAAVDRRVLLVVGGAGRPPAKDAEIHFDQWQDLYEWARQLG